MKVLIITRSSENQSVSLVTEQLAKRGAQVYRFDSDRYPQDIQLSSHYVSGEQRIVVHTPDAEIPIHELDSLWYRRFGAGSRLPDSLGQTLEACRSESELTLFGTIVSLDCFHLDPIQYVRGTDYKELQLREAMRLGLELPPTLISNNPDSVRKFVDQVEGDVITKVQGHFAIYRDGQEQVVFTNRLKREDLDKLDGLQYAPMIFQEAVPKEVELRVTVVGNKVFAGAINSQTSERAQVDWRRDGEKLINDWEAHDFPEEESQKLLKLASFFGLNYAAADFILTPDGRYVFLEINAAGEWLWLEQVCKLPIAEAIAEVLTDPSSRRCTGRAHSS